jgi:hypothetical protein
MALHDRGRVLTFVPVRIGKGAAADSLRTTRVRAIRSPSRWCSRFRIMATVSIRMATQSGRANSSVTGHLDGGFVRTWKPFSFFLVARKSCYVFL